MTQNIENRIKRLEDANSTRLVTVFGRSAEEQDATIERLKSQGLANDRDTFVCVTRFTETATIPEPKFY